MFLVVVVQAVAVTIHSARFLVAGCGLGFYIVQNTVVIRIDIQVVGDMIAVCIYGNKAPATSRCFLIMVIQAISVSVYPTRGLECCRKLGFYIVKDTIIIRIDIQIVRHAIPVRVIWVCFRFIVSIRIEVFNSIHDTIIVVIDIGMVRYAIAIGICVEDSCIGCMGL